MDKPLITITYKTADGKQICVEVPTSVKELLEQSDRQIRSQRRQDRRYLDNSDFIDGLTDTAMKYPQYIDPADLLIRMESHKLLHSAINELSETQRRRLLLYFFGNLTHSQIAKLEGVGRAAITYSISRAIKQLRRYITD